MIRVVIVEMSKKLKRHVRTDEVTTKLKAIFSDDHEGSNAAIKEAFKNAINLSSKSCTIFRFFEHCTRIKR